MSLSAAPILMTSPPLCDSASHLHSGWETEEGHRGLDRRSLAELCHDQEGPSHRDWSITCHSGWKAAGETDLFLVIRFLALPLSLQPSLEHCFLVSFVFLPMADFSFLFHRWHRFSDQRGTGFCLRPREDPTTWHQTTLHFCFVLEMEFQYVLQVGLELASILLPQSPKAGITGMCHCCCVLIQISTCSY